MYGFRGIFITTIEGCYYYDKDAEGKRARQT